MSASASTANGSGRRRSRWRRLRRLLLGIAGVFALAMLCGTAYEFWSRAQAARRHPAPGKLVDIGGRRMQIDCRGEGRPTVVFEAGLDMHGSLSWAVVHDDVAGITRACAYSRAGIMWSDPHAGPQNGTTVAADLHALLANAGEKPPFVLVGHSLGGPYAMTYTKNYGDQVAGLVFVDASHPDQTRRFEEAHPKSDKDKASGEKTAALMAVAAKLTWNGWVRIAAASLLPSPAKRATPVTDAVQREMLDFAPTSLDAAFKESNAVEDTLAEAGKLRQLGERPLVVLTAAMLYSDDVLKVAGMTREQADRMAATWKALHDDEARWSQRSEHDVLDDSTHYIQFDRPDAVVAAVRKVVEQVRAASPPATPDSTQPAVAASSGSAAP